VAGHRPASRHERASLVRARSPVLLPAHARPRCSTLTGVPDGWKHLSGAAALVIALPILQRSGQPTCVTGVGVKQQARRLDRARLPLLRNDSGSLHAAGGRLRVALLVSLRWGSLADRSTPARECRFFVEAGVSFWRIRALSFLKSSTD
jgi:hypothetical protein